VSTQDSVNYPDLLGAITGGVRLNLDVIQGALAVRPAQVAAGRFFEVILLLQNASDIDVDVLVEPVLPERDANNKKGMFLTKSTRLRVGLRPAEVGFVTLPISTSPNTAVGTDYVLGMNVSIKRLDKHPQRVRAIDGGGGFMISELPEVAQKYLDELRSLSFSVNPGSRKNYIQTTVEIQPPAVTSLKELKADWVSMWTVRDYLDEYIIANKVWPQAQNVMGQLSRDIIFMPLLKMTQERFRTANYQLYPPEAIYITKLLTLILEMRVIDPTADNPRPPWPRWFVKMVRLLLQEPALATQVEALVTRLLYTDLVYDAIMHAFTMISTVTNEQFGTEEETSHYAEDIVSTIAAGERMEFARTYFPMVLGGLVVNARVTMPREQVRETVFILSKALDNRKGELTPDNKFVFDLTETLIERALDST
jgi:hypothetical protein